MIWLVAITAYASVFWVMVANSFLQNPVGYTANGDGTVTLTDFGALLSNPSLTMALPHVAAAAITTGGVVMAGVSAWHFIRRTNEADFFRTSLRLGVVVAFVGTFFTIGFGFAQLSPVNKVQPAKFGDDAARQAVVDDFTARFGPGDYLPAAYTSVGYGFMILLAFLLFFVGLLIPLFFRDWIIRLRVPLYLLLLAVPVPFVASILGWLTREGGRQPWAAYGLLNIKDAITPGMSAGSMLASYVAFTAVLAVLAITDWVLIARAANRGPVAPREDALTPLA